MIIIFITLYVWSALLFGGRSIYEKIKVNDEGKKTISLPRAGVYSIYVFKSPARGINFTLIK